MTLHPCIVGIDVSKSTLDVFDASCGRSSRIANAGGPLMALAAQWREAGALVVFEATGSYDEALRRALDAAGVSYSRVDPAKARSFARYAGYKAKTDKLDARMLADMGRHGDLRPDPPIDEDREELRVLQRRRDQLVSMRQMERTRLSEASAAVERDSIQRHVDTLSGEIERFDKAIADKIAASQPLKAAAQTLRQVPGIGPVAATTLLALLPELGQRSAKTIAALVGLAPINNDSGTRRGQRSIQGGRKRVRDALYMAALAASRSQSHFADAYRKLKDAGKPPKLALIAIARKILVTLNAILRDNAKFKNKNENENNEIKNLEIA